MNTSSAARILGISPDTARRWAHEGVVPCRIVERRRKAIYLWDEDTLRAWLSGRDTRTPEQPDWSAVA